MKNKKTKAGKSKKKSPYLGTIIFLSIFAILLAVAAGFLMRQVFESRSETELALKGKNEVIHEKHKLQGQLNNLKEEYAELSQEHQKLENDLEQEKTRIQRLRAAMQDVASPNVSQYENEIERLENKLKDYEEQMQFIEAEKEAIAGEKSQIQKNLGETQSTFNEIKERNEELEEIFEEASLLNISGLTLKGVRETRGGDEPIDRAWRTDKLEVCFIINENIVAEPGERDFYIRIVDSNNKVLTRSTENVFEHNDEEMIYSIKRSINFQNRQEKICSTWRQDDSFDSGYYNVAVYAEGRETGYEMMELD